MADPKPKHQEQKASTAALIGLVRLLARQAAREALAAKNSASASGLKVANSASGSDG